MRWILILVIFLLLAFTTESNAYNFKRIDEGNGEFLHDKKSSPNGKYSIKYKAKEFVTLNSGNKSEELDILLHSARYYWAPNSKKIVFVDSDLENISFTILDVVSKKYVEIDIGDKMEEGEFAPFEILGSIDYYKLNHLLWSKKSDAFYFDIDARKIGNPEIISLGRFAIFLNEKKKSKNSLNVKKTKCKVMVLGEVIDALPTVNPNQRLKMLKEVNSKKDNWIKKCIKDFDKELKKINKYNKKYNEKFLNCNMKNFDKGIKKRYEICGKLLKKE